ncbi:AtpZ/AtpI family protein [Phaeovibrio sulfidiphilus]
MPDTDQTPGPEEIKARLRALRGLPPNGEPAETQDEDEGPGRPSGLGLGMRISVEMVTTIAVGGALGYGLDKWMGSAPFAMVLCLLLGGAAGVMNAYRVVKGLDDSVGLGAAIARKEAKERDKSRGQSG